MRRLAARDRKRHDLRLLGLMGLVLAMIYAETYLRIDGAVSDLVGMVLFGGGVTIGLVGTLVLAFTAPSGAEEARLAAEAASHERSRPARGGTRRGDASATPRLRPVLGEI